MLIELIELRIVDRLPPEMYALTSGTQHRDFNIAFSAPMNAELTEVVSGGLLALSLRLLTARLAAVEYLSIVVGPFPFFY